MFILSCTSIRSRTYDKSQPYVGMFTALNLAKAGDMAFASLCLLVASSGDTIPGLFSCSNATLMGIASHRQPSPLTPPSHSICAVASFLPLSACHLSCLTTATPLSYRIHADSVLTAGRRRSTTTSNHHLALHGFTPPYHIPEASHILLAVLPACHLVSELNLTLRDDSYSLMSVLRHTSR